MLAGVVARLLALGADQPCLENTGLLEEELERVLAWEKILDLEEPTMIEEECTRIEEEWFEYNSWLRSEKVTCPKCGETFALSGVSEKEKPNVDLAEVKRQKALITQWRLRPSCPKPTGGLRPEQLRSKIDAVREKRKNHEAYLEVIADLAKIEPCDYDAWDRYNEAEKNYRILKNKYDLELRSYRQGQELLNKIEELSEKITGVDIGHLQELHRMFLQYETEHGTYLTLKKRYDELMVEHEELEKELECYIKADEGLVELKSKIKLYVIPSLQKVATELVTEMTEGELNEMKITEDFEVTLNGKELNLLSGSEKAVANLALRLGLGCVLTHKIFNVFLGDEIDESMSEERATLVSDSLHKLLGQINQIILISHKDIVADHYISVDKEN
jgi:DNA repair exonuclease SbcCD ATPase subunit